MNLSQKTPRRKAARTETGTDLTGNPNGTVWLCSVAANQIIRLDPQTKQFDVWDVPAGVEAGNTVSPYGMAIPGDGKVWFVKNAVSQLGRFDPATGKFDEFPISMDDVVARTIGMDS